MLQAILPIILLLQGLLIPSIDGMKLFPNQLHCLSTVYLPGEFIDALGMPASPDLVDLYQVEEFVDINSRRSTISITDTIRDDAKIYYNQMGPDEDSERAFSVYSVKTSECTSQLITGWPLASLRYITINLRNGNADMRREHVDVSIGPSGLLYAIESNLSGFVFKTSVFSDSRMTMVDVFTKEIKYETFNGSEKVNIIVHLMTRGRDSPKEGDTLQSVSDRDASLNIALVGACKTGSSDSLESQSDVKEKGKEDGQQQRLVDLQLDKDTFCEPNKLIFSIQYNLVSLYKPGTLVGKSLEDFGQDAGYDFEMEPFVMPVGIGCLSKDISSRPAWQKRITGGDLTDIFSAEYVSLFGKPGVSYVAYDHRKRLLRLDEAGRKNIYHFFDKKSYHIVEFSPPDTYSSVNADDTVGEQCVVLDITHGSSPITADTFLDTQVIGLKYGDKERYLGSRMLDHISYEVFEKEWIDQLRLPMILASAKFPGLKPTENKRLFLTYYAQSISTSKQSAAPAGKSRDKVADDSEGQLLLLSFIEAWEFDAVNKKKRLLNRVKFLEFSWELDVEPANDLQSQKPGSIGARLFDIEPCYQDRAAQGELVIKFIRNSSDGEALQNELKNNQYLVSYVNRYLSSAMSVSSLNLRGTEVRLLDSSDILATTRVVELRTGISTTHDLGVMSYRPGDLDDGIERIVSNRHSHDECRLESISAPSSSWFAYCPNLATCLILKESEHLKSRLIRFSVDGLLTKHKQERSSSPAGIEWDVCAVESFEYATADVDNSGLHRKVLNQAFHFVIATKSKTLAKRFWLKSQSYMVEVMAFQQLDSIGTRLANDLTLLSGLRYTTMEEEPASMNMNTRVVAITRMGAFRFCQLACQMDDICGSFSMCSQPAGDGMELADCVLSSVRLTGERLNTIMAASAENKQEGRFQVNLSDEIHSQMIMMYRDYLCSLHPKDFLASYHVIKTRTMKQTHPLELDGEKTGEKKSRLQKRYLDLEDCAGLNFEVALFDDASITNFTFCPLNSHCIVSSDDYSSQIEDTSEFCYLYEKHSTRAYNVQRMTHMVANKLAAPSNGQSGSSNDHNDEFDAESLLKKLDLVEKYAKSGTKQLATMSWGSSEQKCARDCNMHKSKCLAFDSCRKDGKVLCILYSRRSPMMKESAHFPLLKQERDNLLDYDVELHLSPICNHYYLKEDYFDVRLNAMLTEERETLVVGKANERQQTISELEDKIEAENKEQNEEIVNSLIENVQQSAKDRVKDERQDSTDNRLVHFMPLIFGLVMGAMSILYRQQILDGARQIRGIHKTRVGRKRDSLEDLVLTIQNG